MLTVTLAVHTPDTKVSEVGETTSVPATPVALSGTVALQTVIGLLSTS